MWGREEGLVEPRHCQVDAGALPGCLLPGIWLELTVGKQVALEKCSPSRGGHTGGEEVTAKDLSRPSLQPPALKWAACTL